MTRAEWRVCVDWNGDGDFGGPGEDVTGDVLGLTLDHSRDLLRDRIPAARLEMELRNGDHRYSPPNGRSPLAGSVKPGRKLWVRAAYPFDGFSNTPGTRLAEHSPDYDDGFAWSEHSGGFEIAPTGTGARTRTAAGGGRCVATLDYGDADVSFGCDFTRGGGTAHGGLCFRYSDSSNFLYARVTGSAVEVRKVEGGADSLLASASHAWASGVRGFLQVEMHGASIRIFAGLDAVVETESSFNMGATRHGLFSEGQADHVWEGFGGWVSLFHGGIDSILPRPGRGARYCYVRALDEMERMSTVTLYTYASSAFPQRSDHILGDILDYAGADAGRRRFDAGSTLVPHTFSPAMWGVKALDEIYRLQDEEDGFVYVDGHGYWRLEGRGHRAAGPHASASAIIGETSGGAGAYFSDLAWDDGAANVENAVFVRVRSYTVEGAQTVWTLSQTPRFAANETKVFLAESSAYDTVVGYTPPVARVDYLANSRRNGFGLDITSQLTVSHPDTSGYKGLGTLVSVTFGSRSGYLTLLNLRGVNAIKFGDPVLALADDTASKGAYGERIKTIDARWTSEVAAAQATAESRLERKRQPKTDLRVTVPNGSRANMLLMLQRRISDRVNVSYGNMGIDEDFFIEGHTLTVGEGGRAVTRELVLRGV